MLGTAGAAAAGAAAAGAAAVSKAEWPSEGVGKGAGSGSFGPGNRPFLKRNGPRREPRGRTLTLGWGAAPKARLSSVLHAHSPHIAYQCGVGRFSNFCICFVKFSYDNSNSLGAHAHLLKTL